MANLGEEALMATDTLRNRFFTLIYDTEEEAYDSAVPPGYRVDSVEEYRGYWIVLYERLMH